MQNNTKFWLNIDSLVKILSGSTTQVQTVRQIPSSWQLKLAGNIIFLPAALNIEKLAKPYALPHGSPG